MRMRKKLREERLLFRFMNQKVLIFLLLLCIIALPFVFQQGSKDLVEKTEEKLIVITPHNEAIRYEFTRGFKEWYLNKTGKTVSIDWRVLGGSQEIFRYLNSQYANAFEVYWEKVLGKRWSEKLRDVFSNPNVVLSEHPKNDDENQLARRAFLTSRVSSGIDVLFGGGELEVGEQAAMGNVVASGILELHPEWFQDTSIPQVFGGTYYWDPKGRWIGTTQSGFGIIFNREALAKLHYEGEPKQWADLADPIFFGEVALADPIVSVTANRIFDMMFQQQVKIVINERNLNENSPEDVKEALTDGWSRAVKLIQLVCANARYFSDSSTKPVLDVSAGDCAVGVAIDFYGLYQEENLRQRNESHRFGFVFPKAGSVATPDVIAMLRGAPNPELALAFIEYILSLEGQKLWSFRVGTPGGPIRYTLHCPPIRKELYADEYYDYRSNPELNPYRDVGDFVYHAQWSVPIFKPLRFIIKVAFIDTHKELSRAWKAIIDARNQGRTEDAQRAFEVFQDFDLFNYQRVIGDIKSTLSSGDALDVIKLQGNLTHRLRKQYSEAERLAKGL